MPQSLSDIHEERIRRLEDNGTELTSDLTKVSLQLQYAQETLQTIKTDTAAKMEELKQDQGKQTETILAAINGTNGKIDALTVRVLALEEHKKTTDTKKGLLKFLARLGIAPALVVGGVLLSKFGETIWEWFASLF